MVLLEWQEVYFLTKTPLSLRMLAMAEEEKKYGELEQEFRGVEEELIKKIRLVHKESLKEFPAGVSIEIASDEDKDFRLYIDSNRGWDCRFQMSGWHLGTEPNLSKLLGDFVFVTDKAYREFDPVIQEQYLQANKETFTKGLMEKMRKNMTAIMNDL